MKELIKLCLSDNYEQLEQYVQENKIDLSKRPNITGRTIFEILAINERISNCLSSLMLLRRLGATPLLIANAGEVSEDLKQAETFEKNGVKFLPTERLAYSLAKKNYRI